MSLFVLWLIGLMALQCSSQTTDITLDTNRGKAPAMTVTVNFTEVVCPRIYYKGSGSGRVKVNPELCTLRCKGSNFDPIGGLVIRYRNGSSLRNLPTSRPDSIYTSSREGFSVRTSGSVVTATSFRPLDFVTDRFVCAATNGTVAITQEVRVTDLPITIRSDINPTRDICGNIGSPLKIPSFTSFVDDTLFLNPNTYSRMNRLEAQGNGCPAPTDMDMIVSVYGDIYIMPFRASHATAGCSWYRRVHKEHSSPSRYFSLVDTQIYLTFHDITTFDHTAKSCMNITDGVQQSDRSQMLYVTESPAFMSANSTGGKFYIECIVLPPRNKRIQSTAISWRHNTNVIGGNDNNYQVDSGEPYYTMRMGVTIAERNAGTYSCRAFDGSSGTIELRFARYPEITDLSTKALRLYAGSSAVFDCSWTSNPQILQKEKVRWIHNGNYTTTGTSATISTDIEAQTSQLTIIRLQTSHTGYVSCLVENDVGNVQKDYFMQVDGALSIHENKSGLIVTLTSGGLLLMKLAMRHDF